MDLTRLNTDRKRQLFACACVREVWHLLGDERSRKAVAVAEAFADGLATDEDLRAAAAAAWAASMQAAARGGDWCIAHAAATAVGYAVSSAALAAITACASLCVGAYGSARRAGTRTTRNAWPAVRESAEAPARQQQVLLLDDIAGPDHLPFGPATLDAGCRTPQVMALAQTIYDNRAFDRLLVWADALEEAGCTNADILAHCHQPGPHMRGCWVVDHTLGKT